MTNYPLRLPEHIMAAAKALAVKDGTSLNQFLSSLIAERIGEMRAVECIEARAGRADLAAALKVLERVPDREPLAGDELPDPR